MPNRLSLSEDRLFPVQAFFNALPDAIFQDVMTGLLRGVGASINDARCAFSSDLDPGEEPFDGVRFSLFEDQVVISEAQMREYIREAFRSVGRV